MKPYAFAACAAAILFTASSLCSAQGPTGNDPQRQDVKAGAALFGNSGCMYCHGPTGMGTERAPSLRAVSKRLTDEQIRHQVHDGGKMMPPFGEALTEDEITHLSAFLRAKDAWDMVPAPDSLHETK